MQRSWRLADRRIVWIRTELRVRTLAAIPAPRPGTSCHGLGERRYCSDPNDFSPPYPKGSPVAHFDVTGLQPAADRLIAQGIDVVRVGYADLIGTDRGRDVLVNRFARTVGDGVAFCRSVYGTTPMGDVVDIEGGLDDGPPRRPRLPRPRARCRPIPWEPGVAHCHRRRLQPRRLAVRGKPRTCCKRVIAAVRRAGHAPDRRARAGVLRPGARPRSARRAGSATARPPATCTWPASRATRRTCCSRTLRQLSAYGLEVVAANHEFSSGQFEINLWHSRRARCRRPSVPLQGAVQELARQEDKLATFMAKPFNDEGGSGFHLHFSTWSTDGRTTAVRRPRGPRTDCRRSPGTAIAGSAGPRARAGRRRQPDDQLLQAVRPRHPRSVADRLGPGQPQRDGADPARARLRRPAWSSGSATPAPTPTSPSPALLAAAYSRDPRQARAARAAGGLRLRPDQGGQAAR